MEAYHRDFGSAANGVLLSEVKQGSADEWNESSGAVTNPGAKWD